MPGVRDQGPFPELALPDLEGRPRPLSETWRDGPALFLIGHQSCRTTRSTTRTATLPTNWQAKTASDPPREAASITGALPARSIQRMSAVMAPGSMAS